MKKNNYLQFIKQCSTINVSAICKELNINRENVLHGKSSEATTKLVYDELIRRIRVLLKGGEIDE